MASEVNRELPLKPETVDFFHNRVHSQVKEILTANTALPWTSFTLAHNSDGPTIRVTTKDVDHHAWPDAVNIIQSVLESAPERITVEIVHASVELLAIQSVPFKPFALGNSAGIQGVPKGSGTIGGYVVLTSPAGESRIYGLTNNHVVNISPSTQKQNPEPAWIYNDNTIVVPSKDDLEETRAVNKDTPKESFKLGKVKYASGRKVTGAAPFHVLDWALVSVSDGTYSQERLHNKKLYKVNYQPALTTRAPSIAGPVIDVGPLQGGLRVWKYGRTSGITEGLISQTQVELRVAELDVWKGGKVLNPANVVSTAEWVAYLPNGGRDFCDPGDSGSWVLDTSGRLVGLLWGKVNDRCLVTDIHVVFASILDQADLRNFQISILMN